MDLLKKTLNLVDQQLVLNIENNETPVLQPLEEAKASQLLELLKRVNTSQFCHLKYAANFGISIETQVHIKSNVFCGNKDFSKISVEDVNNVLLYLEWAILRIENL
jgi:hypothetical protein